MHGDRKSVSLAPHCRYYLFVTITYDFKADFEYRTLTNLGSDELYECPVENGIILVKPISRVKIS